MRNFSEKISRGTAVKVPKEWMFSIRTYCKVGSRLELAQGYDHLQIFWYIYSGILSLPARVPKHVRVRHLVASVHTISEPIQSEERHWLIKIMSLYF